MPVEKNTDFSPWVEKIKIQIKYLSMDSKKNILITAALPYVNNYPHLGNIIGSMLSADAYSRFLKFYYTDRKIIYICGTDEHGTPIELEAKKRNMTPIDLCNQYSKEHKKIYDWFNISFDYFGRTTIKEHRETTQRIFTQLYENGHFYKKEEKRPFCENCDNFLADRFIKGTCYHCSSIANGDQCDGCTGLIEVSLLKNPFCAICQNEKIIEKSTVHLYFKIKNFIEELKSRLNFENFSLNAQRITKDWLEKMSDRPMTRDLSWGIPVPDMEGKVFYVWFDAPIAYLTFASLLENDIFSSSDWSITQFMGKDNVIFHSIFFPAFLLGSDHENIVDHISSTEYLLFNGEKFSKSKGVGIFGSDLLSNKMGASDFFRFYLLKIRPEKSDSNFSPVDFINCTNNFQNTFCNLVSRIIKFINKAGGLVLYEGENLFTEFIAQFNKEYKKYLEAFRKIKIRQAVDQFLTICTLLNNFLQQSIGKEERTTAFHFAFSPLILIILSAAPLVPDLFTKYKKIINYEFTHLPEELIIVRKHMINYEGEVFFEKLRKEQIEQLESFK